MDERIEKNVGSTLKDFLGEEELPQITKKKVVAPVVEDDYEDEEEETTMDSDVIIPQMDAGFKPMVDDVSPQQKIEERGVKPKLGEVDGKILTITEVEITMPKTKEFIDGTATPVPPKETKNSGAKFYEAKLKVRFAENNFAEFYPGIKFWVNDNKINQKPSIDRSGHSKVTQIFRMAIVKMAKADGHNFELITTSVNEKLVIVPSPKCIEQYKAYEMKVSDAKILQYLVGKKVLMKESTGTYDGKAWIRSDFAEILD